MGRVPSAKASTRSRSQRISRLATVERLVTVAQRTYRTRAVECPVTDPAVIQAANNERQHPV
jgi:hypothetical protein